MNARRHGRTALAALLACVCASAGRPAASDEPSRARGFDHLWHEGRVSVAGGEPVPCQRCHTVDLDGELVGQPDHASCYGDCHGPAPTRRVLGRAYPILEDRRRQCETCHPPHELRAAEAGGDERVGVAQPPYVLDAEHGLHMSHAAHDGPSRDLHGCRSCHAAVGQPGQPRQEAKARPHARCLVCHARAVDARTPGMGPEDDPDAPDAPDAATMPHMSDCLACHGRAFGPRTRPYLAPGIFPVSQRFAHETHAQREPLACVQCHTAVPITAGNELASPTMGACRTCHDGDKAFATTGAHCQRCHTKPAVETTLRPREEVRFDHEDHGVAIAGCDRCHTLDERGFPGPPSADHEPCAGCHLDEFESTKPTICSVCHVGSEPWRPLHFDQPPRPDTEFGARYSHRAHAREYGETRPCQACHGTRSESRDMRLARDHRACSGPGCHQDEGRAPAPSLDRCADCHVVGLIRARQRQRARTPFSVRARFVHAPHEQDPRTGAALACTTCHGEANQATRIDDMPTPRKQTCATCHDGAVAFKVTGHGCVRCHESAATDP